jgi:hypothetical protein
VLNVKVEQQSDFHAAQFQIRENLCHVNVSDRFDALEFQNNALIHNQVEKIAHIELHPVILDGQRNFAFHKEAIFDQFMLETSVVSAL